jgi:ABC-type transport system involved in multi-copper enzyme maturation permease subunit
MTAVMTPYRSQAPAGGDGFGPLLRAEWTKLRTVRGWLGGLGVGAVLTVLFGLLGAAAIHLPQPASPVATGPDGEPVRDGFYFVHQSMTGDGSITVPVSALTAHPDAGPAGGARAVTIPWAKAGILIKESTRPTSSYAAIAVTGSHGVRLQYDFTHDTPGLAGAASAASPRWLRLTRAGDTVTGYNSTDGSHWTEVGTARPSRLPSTVQVGLFVTSPDYIESANQSSTSIATATFGEPTFLGQWRNAGWNGDEVGGDPSSTTGGFTASPDGFTVRGAGDIAPMVGGIASPGNVVPLENFLLGAFVGLIALMVVATTFITAEYRRGLIRTTFTATSGRGRVLLAKAVVIGAATFVVGLVAAAVAIAVCEPVARANGFTRYPVSSLTEARVVIGTAVLLAGCAVLALAVGALLRRGAGAVTVVVALIVLPYILATSYVLPAGPSDWLLRVTPAAGFAIQQTVRAYPQVFSFYTPSAGYFPLSPIAGLAVLCGYAALALGLAVLLLRRRDV